MTVLPKLDHNDSLWPARHMRRPGTMARHHAVGDFVLWPHVGRVQAAGGGADACLKEHSGKGRARGTASAGESGASGPPQKVNGIDRRGGVFPTLLFTKRRPPPTAALCARPPSLPCRPCVTMSFPYHQYVDYSNPATPRVYAWEVASSTSTSEHDAALKMPPQDPQQQLQPQQISPSQLQPQQISPSQLQLHQLPLPLPQAQHPPRHTSPQELRSQHQQPAQYAPQQPQPQQQQRAPAPQTIHVPPPPAAGQPQYRFETITEQDFVSATAPRRRGASKPPLHVDTARPASSASAPAGSPSALSSAGAGPLRVPHARAHAQAAHPYRGARPQSRAASGSGSGAGVGQAQHGAVRSRRVSEMHASSPGAQTPLGAAAATTSAGGVVPPAVGTAMAVSCPAADSWRESLLGLSGASETRTPGAGGRCVLTCGPCPLPVS